MKKRLQLNGYVVAALVLVLAGCASRQPAPGEAELVAAAPPVSPERRAAVAEIRKKVADAEIASADTESDADQLIPPPTRPLRSYREVNAIEAELKMIAETAKQTSNAAELAALRKRAAELEALRQEPAADDDVDTGSIDQ